MNLHALLWAIYIAEGATKASVPFGYLPLKPRWQKGQVSFYAILKAVARELRIEKKRYDRARKRKEVPEGKDFIWWLAWKGYNANPAEAATWERNVRRIYAVLSVLEWEGS